MRSTDAIRIISTLILAAFITFIDVYTIDAANSNKKTPYGDYCKRTNNYGMHKSLLDVKQSVEALKHYYGEKGFTIDIISNDGRFMKVRVKDKNKVLDTIIFDRRSGRVRTIY